MPSRARAVQVEATGRPSWALLSIVVRVNDVLEEGLTDQAISDMLENAHNGDHRERD
jgi:hypothetical protein